MDTRVVLYMGLVMGGNGLMCIDPLSSWSGVVRMDIGEGGGRRVVNYIENEVYLKKGWNGYSKLESRVERKQEPVCK